MEEEIFTPPDSSGTFTEIPEDPIFDVLRKGPSEPVKERKFTDHLDDIDVTDPRPPKVDVFDPPRSKSNTGKVEDGSSAAVSTGLGEGIGAVTGAVIGKFNELTVVPSEFNKVMGFVGDVISGNELPQERANRELAEKVEKQNQEAWIDYLSGRNAATKEQRAEHPLNVEMIRKATQEANEDASLFKAEEAFRQAEYEKIRSALERDRKKKKEPERKYPCDYPWDLDSKGRKCGKRAAIVKRGGWPEGPRWHERGLPFG